MEKIKMVITARERDLGGFSVRRILPYATHPMVGPFIFFDHMGPANFSAGQGIDVRPHPHINLATVTYLFEGQICHRDSLGSIQLIEPGAINWMIAGHGIVHSERTPENLRQTGSRLSGIQCWVAMPEEYEEMAPNFTHYSAESLPKFQINDVELQLLLGNAFEHTSPVKVQSDLFYIHAKFPKQTKLIISAKDCESAAYIAEGRVQINGQEINQFSMAIGHPGENLEVEAFQNSQLMLLGGKPLGKRYIYWNFVSSTEQKIEKAKSDWQNGPGETGSRFPKIPSDDQEYIPLPDEVKDKNPKGTIM